MKDFWIMFFKDPQTGILNPQISKHNCVGDCKNHPHFIGYEHIKVDMDSLKRS